MDVKGELLDTSVKRRPYEKFSGDHKTILLKSQK